MPHLAVQSVRLYPAAGIRLAYEERHAGKRIGTRKGTGPELERVSLVVELVVLSESAVEGERQRLGRFVRIEGVERFSSGDRR